MIEDKIGGDNIMVEIKGACRIAFFAAILMLMLVIPVAMAVSGKLWLEPIPPGTYVGDSEDDWLKESYVTTDTQFDLEITYHNGQEDISHLYLLVAVDRNPAGNVIVTVDGNTVGDYDGVITSNNNALITETDPDYQYPGHGIYKYGSSTHFEVVVIQIPGDGILKKGETITVHVEIEPIASAVKVHFDAVGADSAMEAIAFVPPSHDVTYQVPEFSTIAVPIVSILGLLFFFNYRKRRKE
jgi:hypothetical protein